MTVPFLAAARRLGFAAILLLAVVALRWNYAHQGGGFISDDGIQYMDAASNFRAGSCLCTTVAHFDEQIAPGTMPVPFTHFAPGYSLLIALTMRAGGLPSVESAALLVASAGHLLSLALLWILATSVFGASRPIAAGACLLWAGNSLALFYASATSSEPLFTAFVLLFSAGIGLDWRYFGRKNHFLVLLAAAAGFSYWIRYPGVFLVIAAAAYILWRAWQSRTWLWPAAAMASLGLLSGAVALRNTLLTGSWRGGFANMQSHETLPGALAGSIKAAFQIVLGERVRFQWDGWIALLLLSLAVLAWVALLRDRRRITLTLGGAYLCLGAVAGLYTAFMIYASTQTIASAFTRYYLPLYPLALAVGAALVSAIPSSLWRNAALAGILLAIMGTQARHLAAPAPDPGFIAVRDALQADPATNVREWLLHNTEAQDVLFATNGQALHYVLGGQRPVVSIPAPAYTNRTDDEAGVRRLMEHFRSRYLVVFRTKGPEVLPEFLSGLAAASASGEVPDWLQEAVRTPAVVVFERKGAGQGGR